MSSKRSNQSIKTYLRIKPITQSEQNFLSSVSNTSVVVRGQQEYIYDRVFDAYANNSSIFQHIGEPLIQHCIEGYNACVLAYGQTASGKTYTMKGNEDNQGIIPLTLRRLFQKIEQQQLVAQIKISYIEIYNENIIDLLSPTEAYLEIREDPRKNITILGLTQTRVQQVNEAMKLFTEGQSRRKFASNNLNIASSRSHAIFRMNVQIVHADYVKTTSSINMVDLAGSEGVSRTKAEGSTRKEGQNINKSILALSNVIRCMSQKQSYINFRDSKLTRILQNSLCNNSRSVVICTVNPIAINYQQTINTLKFGMYASQIKLQLKKNVSQTSQRIPESEAKSTHGQILQPQQRVEYQQNKRNINTLRQENQELRDYKKILNEKIEFLELQNHRFLKKVQDLQHILQSKRVEISTNEQKTEFQKQLQSLKGQMQIMADKYEALNQYSSKLQKNEKYLIERITKYQSQISILKEEAEQKHISPKKANTPQKAAKQKPFKPAINQSQEVCPLTIGSIIVLKAQIIELKQNIFGLNQEIAALVEQRNQFLAEIELIRDNHAKEKLEIQGGQVTDLQKKQIKNLHIRIKKLQNQLHNGKNREKKLTKMLRQSNAILIEQFNQFNEWYADKKQRIDSIKKQKFGSSRKSSRKQNQAIQL